MEITDYNQEFNYILKRANDEKNRVKDHFEPFEHGFGGKEYFRAELEEELKNQFKLVLPQIKYLLEELEKEKLIMLFDTNVVITRVGLHVLKRYKTYERYSKSKEFDKRLTRFNIVFTLILGVGTLYMAVYTNKKETEIRLLKNEIQSLKFQQKQQNKSQNFLRKEIKTLSKKPAG